MKSDRIRLRLVKMSSVLMKYLNQHVWSCTCQPERHITVKLVFVKISLS